ncbi:MAG: ribonuclease III [Deltaproteobacteria bacterium]|nr:MAG: ribonuclease III [Deltaproteobacteria bacterium]
MSRADDIGGYRFASPELLEEALRHGSAHVKGEEKRSYERLEFLGDAVLNLCVAEEMYRTLPMAGEGILTRARAAVINNRNLLKVGERIGVPALLATDPSVRKKGGGVTRKMTADAVEAIVGAIFVDAGFDAARDFVLRHFRVPDFLGQLVSGFDAKSRLQERCQGHGEALPEYRLLSTEGPDHERTFEVEVLLPGRAPSRGKGKTKKEAEMAAAAQALSLLGGPEAETP